MQDQMEPASREVIGPVNLEGDTQDLIVRGLGASQVYVFSTVGTGKPRGVFQQKKKKKSHILFFKKDNWGCCVGSDEKRAGDTSRGCCKNAEGVEGELEEGRAVDGYRTGLGGVGHGAQSSLGSQGDGQRRDAQTVCLNTGAWTPGAFD